MYPKLTINLQKLVENTNRMKDLCLENNITNLCVVVKVMSGDLRCIQAISSVDIDYLGDSRIENLKRFQELKPKKALMRLPMPHQAYQVVKYSDMSLNSEIDTIRKLNIAAQKQNKKHEIILMFDMGDLREGIFFQDPYLEIVDEILSMDNIILKGIGTNLTCYGGVIPSQENLTNLVKIAHSIEHEFDITLPIISGGNSSSVFLFGKGLIPHEINNLRIGEAIFLGRETAYGNQIPYMHEDIFTLYAEIIEIKEKPSYPIGEIGMNSFGEVPQIKDLGMMKRAILAVGKQDVQIDNIVPIDSNISIVGGSSDHLIIDLKSSNYQLGDVISFRPNYPGLLQLMTSKYIKKEHM
ncbi:MAG: alanine racemase [Tenericutes bacterium HGW-Tenericutes-1]|jgi:predicted amino acid racemase|nr:MAG: alanine racemase [Tenericutes bacterium HGW-Tenericutes-1]